MLPLNFTLQAYIPKSLGRPLLSYFQNLPYFNSKQLTNYDQFKSNLESMDRLGGTWLPEPFPMTSRFFMTDDSDFHKNHTKHSYRLRVKGKLDLAKVGNYSFFDTQKIFEEDNQKQSSYYSHRCVAYINNNVYEKFDKPFYVGFFEKFEKRANENYLNFSVRNEIQGANIFPIGAQRYNAPDTTVIEVKASAAYPFLPSPDVDLNLKISIRKINERDVRITFEGEHDDFPAYELLVNDRVIYSYSPASKGYDGPTPVNLMLKSKKFYHTISEQLPVGAIL